MKKIAPDKFTLHLNSIMDRNDPNDPIVKQFIADEIEENVAEYEITDPIGDDVYLKTKGLIHRYPDRALLMPRQDCLVTCRFCFRKWKLADEKSELSREEIDSAIEYIKNHAELWEIILTGGEPLVTSKEKLKYLLSQLNDITHLKILRIHTRLPIVAPELIDKDLLDAIKTKKTEYIVIHCNHAKELTEDVCAGLSMFADAGIPLLCQTALLKGVNDSPETLEALLRKLVENRVKPYYLHHCDLVEGAQHFRTTFEEGREILKKLRGNISGICWPTYVLDIPGGFGKVPLGSDYVEYRDGETYVTDYRGNQHLYPPKD